VSRTTAELLREVLELPDEERAGLVVELLDSLGPQPSSEQWSDEAWIAEVERRARAAIAGSPGISWDEARAKIKDRLGSR
jgi:putative addiction module component (TIGR02574 family)